MEKFKQLFAAIVEYCANTPFHAVVVIGLVVFILAVAVAIVTFSVREKKIPPKRLGNRTILNATLANEKIEETSPQEQSAEHERSLSVEAGTPIISQDISKEEISEKSLLQKEDEHASAPIVQTKPMEWTEPASKVKEQKTAATQKDDGKIEKTNTITSKEGTMLLDELKDINTELDFYEEDETDRVARYSGKWVICRVVTNDSENEDMYFFELHSANGEKLLSSEEYTNYNAAVRGIETHKSNILRGNFRVTPTKSGDYTYKLLNGKGMLLCMGDHYESKAACERVLDLAKRFARTAFVDENIQDVVVKVPNENETPVPALPQGYNGKWVIDCRVSAEGERVFYFDLLSETEECLLTSEEYSSYIGTVNSIQTHKMNIKNGNFRVSLTKRGDYVYKLLNGNGQLLCLGEHYKTKRLCENAVELIKRYAINSPILTDPELTKE